MAKRSYYRRPDGLYETTRTVNGKRVRFRGRTCAEVDRKILEYNTQVKKGRKVSAILDEWERVKEREVVSNTMVTYAPYIANVRQWAGNRYAGDVRPADVSRFVDDFAARGYAGGTVDLQLSIVKQLFSFAVRRGDIITSPATEVYKARHLPKGTRRALTEDEERLVEEYRGEDYLLGLMLLYTGFRRGELLALEWQDIDRQSGVIRLVRKLNYGGGVVRLEHHLKNGDTERVIPLLAPLAAALPRNRIGRIFTGPDGDYLTQSQFQKRWKRYREAVGLPEDVTPHCFRHSLATICFEAGVSARDLAAFLGDTVQVAEKVYVELRERHHSSAAERVNAYLQMRMDDRAEHGAEG